MKRLASVLVLCLAAAASAEASGPNIVLLLADDFGYGDISCFNPQRGKLSTPSIDRLAEQGIRFTDCHSPSSVCSPTRYGLLTGRYAWRTRLQAGVLKPFDPPLIDRHRLTLPALLRRHGYTTACIGKWHLGWQWPRENEQIDFDGTIADGPTTRGFDYYFGTDVPNYPPYCFIENDRTVGQPTAHKPEKDIDGPPGPELPGWRRDEILPTLLDKSVEFLRQRAADKKPFFLYVPLTSPHEPIAPSEAFRGKSGISPVGDFILETDWAVGQIVKAIDGHGLRDNTLVIFTADNGHSPYTEPNKAILVNEGHVHGHYPSGPWRGLKSDIWEGGHRVPTVVRWPGKVKAGTVSDALVCLTDWMATVAELLGAHLSDEGAEDSVSFLQVLLAGDAGRRETVIVHSVRGNFAVRRGRWKLIFCPGSGGYGSFPADAKAREMGLPAAQLYDLTADPGETRNLHAERPEIVQELTALLDKQIGEGRSTPGKPQPNDVAVQWRPRTGG
ncbi:MAG: arylsulfatase [Phycisphaerae bacterium]